MFFVQDGAIPPTQYHVKIISISLGSSLPVRCPDYLQTAVTDAVNSGIHVFVAAGNEQTTSEAYALGNCKGVIIVGASDYDGTLAYFSNTRFHIAAPGFIDVMSPDGQGGSYSRFFAGTSASCPMAAAMFTLGTDDAMYGESFMTHPTTEPWSTLETNGCISKGIVSFTGDPMEMKPCIDCDVASTGNTHLDDDRVYYYSDTSWFFFYIIFVALLLFLCAAAQSQWFEARKVSIKGYKIVPIDPNDKPNSSETKSPGEEKVYRPSVWKII